jgi:hypothetical protein
MQCCVVIITVPGSYLGGTKLNPDQERRLDLVFRLSSMFFQADDGRVP